MSTDPRTASMPNKGGPARKVRGELEPGTSSGPHAPTVEHLRHLAWLLDEAITIPGLNIKVGLDSLVGLIPGIGDIISTGVSAYIIRAGAQLGVPKSILVRMSFNSAIDFVIGSVPLVGDIFDVGWKANKRNVKLLVDYLENPHQAKRSSSLAVVGMLAAVATAIILLIIGFIAVISWLF